MRELKQQILLEQEKVASINAASERSVNMSRCWRLFCLGHCLVAGVCFVLDHCLGHCHVVTGTHAPRAQAKTKEYYKQQIQLEQEKVASLNAACDRYVNMLVVFVSFWSLRRCLVLTFVSFWPLRRRLVFGICFVLAIASSSRVWHLFCSGHCHGDIVCMYLGPKRG